MSRIRTIKSQSRPASAVARVGGEPTARRIIGRSSRIKLTEDPKVQRNGAKQIIRFEGYHDLVERSLEETAIEINHLLDPNYEKENECKLRKSALKDFLRFSKKDVFQSNGSFCVTREGYLSVDWYLPRKISVNIVFHGKNVVMLYILTPQTTVGKLIPFASIIDILKHYSVPV